jgi:hypothetical protein
LTAFIFSVLNYKMAILLSQTESTPKYFFRKKALHNLCHLENDGGGCCGNSSGGSGVMTQTNFHLFPANYTTFLRGFPHPLAILHFDLLPITQGSTNIPEI